MLCKFVFSFVVNSYAVSPILSGGPQSLQWKLSGPFQKEFANPWARLTQYYSGNIALPSVESIPARATRRGLQAATVLQGLCAPGGMDAASVSPAMAWKEP